MHIYRKNKKKKEKNYPAPPLSQAPLRPSPPTCHLSTQSAPISFARRVLIIMRRSHLVSRCRASSHRSRRLQAYGFELAFSRRHRSSLGSQARLRRPGPYPPASFRVAMVRVPVRLLRRPRRASSQISGSSIRIGEYSLGQPIPFTQQPNTLQKSDGHVLSAYIPPTKHTLNTLSSPPASPPPPPVTK